MYRYEIYIDPVNYVANLIVNDGKIVWEKKDNGIIFRKRLDGKFSLNRTGNELLFDKLMSITFCESGMLSIYDSTGLIAQAGFSKKSLSISEDKCRIDIKFEKYDEYSNVYSILEKEVNMLEMPIGIKTAISSDINSTTQIEYNVILGLIIGQFVDVLNRIHNPTTEEWSGWNGELELAQWGFKSNVSSYPITTDPNEIVYVPVVTTYVRQIIYVERVGEEQSPTPTNTGSGCDTYSWVFDSYNADTNLDKFVRKVFVDNFTSSTTLSNGIYTHSYLGELQSDCYSATNRYSRCRKLNDVIKELLLPYFTDFESIFFKTNINPISGKDLSNILISQKSDCIGTTTDPAIKANVTLKGILSMLQNMFDVYWAIDENGKFRIEHKKYWDNNGSYTVANDVDIDLTVVYPIALIGTNEYSFEENIPIREKFTFMESWRTDFIGKDIDYSECIVSGETIEYSVPNVTTDISQYLLSAYASKEGFCLFHCFSENTGVVGEENSFKVIEEKGELSNIIYENAHLSWANLHEYYWKYDRYLPYGKMNDKQTDFEVRPLKYQKSISFPYCVSEFNPKKLIKTNLGNGIVRSASFSFKTNFITVELEYIDNL